MTETQAIQNINFLYNLNSVPPTSTEEDYLVWRGLLNVAVNVWENEEGMQWNELFVKLADAATGDKTATTGDWSYSVPTDFKFPNSKIVWIGSGSTKTAFPVIDIKDKQLYENNSDYWCYFTGTTLEFNPNCTVPSGTLTYDYFKTATQMTAGASVIEMSDPMFAVYYVLNELKKDEGDATAGGIASQKLEAMRTKNFMSMPNKIEEELNI